MIKAILVSKPPKIVASVLNEKISVLVFNRFPKKYRGLVYIYCTKGKETLAINPYGGYALVPNKCENEHFNGKVVTRFYCDNVEEIKIDYAPRDTFFQECGLTPIELYDYIGHSKWYAVHISQLEIFDEPRALWEFKHTKKVIRDDHGYPYIKNELRQLINPPKSYRHIETKGE